jgi:hypothetical protein
LSLIRRQLEPSLSELTSHGYLAGWSLEDTSDGRAYKIVATHGNKFYRDQKIRSPLTSPTLLPGTEPSLISQLKQRGVNEIQAKRLLRSLPEGQPVRDQLEYGDCLIRNARETIKNPPGFYVYLLRENITPPEEFETSAKLQMRKQQAANEQSEQVRKIRLEHSWLEFCQSQIRERIDGMEEEARKAALGQKMRGVRRQWGHLPEATIEEIAYRQLENDVRQNLPLPTFEEFAKRSPQQSLF